MTDAREVEELNKREHVRWMRTRATDADILMLRQARQDLLDELGAALVREGRQKEALRLMSEALDALRADARWPYFSTIEGIEAWKKGTQAVYEAVGALAADDDGGETGDA